jgi:predicted enzyme related to lactoylglutathione lyase
MIDTGTDIGGGVGPLQGADQPGGITVYAKVDDLQAYLDRAEKLGGTTVVPPTALPGDFGHFAVFTDPDGNAFGLWS